jgi:hypothetical protein
MADKPFDMLTAPSKVEGLTAQPATSSAESSEVEGRPWHPAQRGEQVSR